jgi:hypothetical protein
MVSKLFKKDLIIIILVILNFAGGQGENLLKFHLVLLDLLFEQVFLLDAHVNQWHRLIEKRFSWLFYPAGLLITMILGRSKAYFGDLRNSMHPRHVSRIVGVIIFLI